MVMLTMVTSPSQEEAIVRGHSWYRLALWLLDLDTSCCGCHRSELQREQGPRVFRKETLQPLL